MAFSEHFADLESKIVGSFAKAQILNKELLEKLLDEALEVSSTQYSQNVVAIMIGEALTPQQFRNIHEKSEQNAIQKFNEMTLPAKSETIFSVFETKSKTNIHALYAKFDRQNNERIKDLVTDTIAQIVSIFRSNLNDVYAILPLEETELYDSTHGFQQSALNSYLKKLSNYSEAIPYKDGLENLKEKINDQIEALKKQNIEQLKIACKDSFARAKRTIQSNINNFYLTWSFRRYAYTITEKELGNGIRSSTLKIQVINSFMEVELAEEFATVTAWSKRLSYCIIATMGIAMYGYWKISSRSKTPLTKKNK